MNKRKLLTLAMTLCMVAILAIGGTLAYFSDTDAQTNVFTTGNVAIDLWEDFGDNDAEGIEELIPAVGNNNKVEKEIYVTNDGSEDAYVRIHFAIPKILDSGDPEFNASANTLHWNFWNYGNKQWNWTPDANEAGYVAGSWNYYETTIDEVVYNVYVATYETALKNEETTPNAVWQVYLDSKTTNEQVSSIKEAIGDEWKILVAAEGTQAAGFADAYTALNEAFGDPTDSDYTSQIDWETVSGRTWINND